MQTYMYAEIDLQFVLSLKIQFFQSLLLSHVLPFVMYRYMTPHVIVLSKKKTIYFMYQNQYLRLLKLKPIFCGVSIVFINGLFVYQEWILLNIAFRLLEIKGDGSRIIFHLLHFTKKVVLLFLCQKKKYKLLFCQHL